MKVRKTYLPNSYANLQNSTWVVVSYLPASKGCCFHLERSKGLRSLAYLEYSLVCALDVPWGPPRVEMALFLCERCNFFSENMMNQLKISFRRDKSWPFKNGHLTPKMLFLVLSGLFIKITLNQTTVEPRSKTPVYKAMFAYKAFEKNHSS